MADGVRPEKKRGPDLPRKPDYFGKFDGGDDDAGDDWKVA
jgi:hypothetical protein